MLTPLLATCMSSQAYDSFWSLVLLVTALPVGALVILVTWTLVRIARALEQAASSDLPAETSETRAA